MRLKLFRLGTVHSGRYQIQMLELNVSWQEWVFYKRANMSGGNSNKMLNWVTTSRSLRDVENEKGYAYTSPGSTFFLLIVSFQLPSKVLQTPRVPSSTVSAHRSPCVIFPGIFIFKNHIHIPVYRRFTGPPEENSSCVVLRNKFWNLYPAGQNIPCSIRVLSYRPIYRYH